MSLIRGWRRQIKKRIRQWRTGRNAQLEARRLSWPGNGDALLIAPCELPAPVREIPREPPPPTELHFFADGNRRQAAYQRTLQQLWSRPSDLPFTESEMHETWFGLDPDYRRVFHDYPRATPFRSTSPVFGRRAGIPADAMPRFLPRVLRELDSDATGAFGVESAVRLHHLLVWMHPYSNGNGRLAMALSRYRLKKAGYPTPDFRGVSRTAYYDALNRAHEGDLRRLAGLFAEAIRAGYPKPI